MRLEALKRRLGSAGVFASFLLLAACALNPATGKRQFTLISEQQELQIGRENDKAISAQMGLYDDPELQAYVQQLGASLAAASERPDLEWTFRVVDDPIVNAFALPGGYIYITRGIMAHMNNEAELVSVIGHEIGHVTARHGVTQMSKAQLAQLGLGVGMILAPEAMEQFGGLAQTGLGLLFLKYGRDDERQADDLGLRYMSRVGYDPNPMPGVFDMLGRVSAAAGGGRVPGWMSTHPLPENRSARISQQIADLGQDFSGRPINAAEFLRRIDNVAFGTDPREGYFKENVFYHPELKFRLTLPQGWKFQNQKQAVVGAGPEEDAFVQLTLAVQPTAQAALQEFFSQQGVTHVAGWSRSINGLPTQGAGFTVAVQGGTIQGAVAFVEHGRLVFQLLGFTDATKWRNHEQNLVQSIASFGPLTDRRYIDVEAKRLRIIALSQSMDLETFARRYRSSVPLETLALINRLDPGERLRAGRSYKVVSGGELP